MQYLTQELLRPQLDTISIHESISMLACDVLGLARARGADLPDEWPDGSRYKRATGLLARRITYLLDESLYALYATDHALGALCILDAIARDHGATLAEIMDAS